MNESQSWSRRFKEEKTSCPSRESNQVSSASKIYPSHIAESNLQTQYICQISCYDRIRRNWNLKWSCPCRRHESPQTGELWLSLSNRWRSEGNITPGHFTTDRQPSYQFNKTLGGPQSRSGRLREEKIFATGWGSNPGPYSPKHSNHTHCAIRASISKTNNHVF
jgi:hypothetical protein